MGAGIVLYSTTVIVATLVVDALDDISGADADEYDDGGWHVSPRTIKLVRGLPPPAIPTRVLLLHSTTTTPPSPPTQALAAVLACFVGTCLAHTITAYTISIHVGELVKRNVLEAACAGAGQPPSVLASPHTHASPGPSAHQACDARHTLTSQLSDARTRHGLDRRRRRQAAHPRRAVHLATPLRQGPRCFTP